MVVLFTSTYPSARFSPQQANGRLAGNPAFARLGNVLGYLLPRLPALDSGQGGRFVAPGNIFERG